MSNTYASPGAVKGQGQPLPVTTCRDCAADIVFATSRRTGNRYPVNVRYGQADQPYFMGNDLHKCIDQSAAIFAIQHRDWTPAQWIEWAKAQEATR